MNHFDENQLHRPLPPPDFPRDRVADTGNAVVTALCTAALALFAAAAIVHWMLP